MNINSEYNSNEEKSFAEMAEIAMDSVEANIVSKALDNLEIIDIDIHCGGDTDFNEDIENPDF